MIEIIAFERRPCIIDVWRSLILQRRLARPTALVVSHFVRDIITFHQSNDLVGKKFLG
jgi:hypothetical protein